MSRRSSAATSGQNGRATHWKRGSRVVEHGGACGGWWRRWRSNLHQPPPTSRTSTNLRRASEREPRRAGPPRRDLSRAARGAGRFGGETAAAQAGHDPRRDRPDDQAGPARARHGPHPALAAGGSEGGVRAMALSIFEEWRLAHDADAFRDWLARGAPSDDALTE